MRFAGRNEEKFSGEAINSVLNLVKVPESIHIKLHAYLNSAVAPGGLLLRDLIFEKSFAE